MPFVIVLTSVAVISLAIALSWTHSSPPWAFFSLPSRAWELAVGGLTAFAAVWWRRVQVSRAAGSPTRRGSARWCSSSANGWSASNGDLLLKNYGPSDAEAGPAHHLSGRWFELDGHGLRAMGERISLIGDRHPGAPEAR